MIIELNKSDISRVNELETSFGFVLKDITSDIDNNPFSKYLLYIEDDKIVGYINYYLMYDKMEIANFNVLDDYQNKGIGGKLLSYLIDNYKNNVDNITLEVKCDNNKAIYLYKKNGFVETTIRKGYYNGVDAILMERRMK